MQIVLILHSLFRWAVLIFGLWTLVNALTGFFSKRTFSSNDNRSNLLFMISCDIQLLIGLILYFFNGWFERLKDLGNNMKDANSRFFTMEHMSVLIIAWVLVHIGRASVKKAQTDPAKHKRMLIFFGIALLLIFISIPWPFRQLIERPYFRWFN